MRFCGWPVTLIILLTWLAGACGKVDGELALDKRQLGDLGSLLGNSVPSDTASAKKSRTEPTPSSSDSTDGTPSSISVTSDASTSQPAPSRATTKPPASHIVKATANGRSSTTTLVALSTSHVSKISSAGNASSGDSNSGAPSSTILIVAICVVVAVLAALALAFYLLRRSRLRPGFVNPKLPFDDAHNRYYNHY